MSWISQEWNGKFFFLDVFVISLDSPTCSNFSIATSISRPSFEEVSWEYRLKNIGFLLLLGLGIPDVGDEGAPKEPALTEDEGDLTLDDNPEDFKNDEVDEEADVADEQ